MRDTQRSPQRIFRVLDGVADTLGLGKLSLDADALLAGALKKAGRNRFGDVSFLPALRLLLRCYEDEAQLNVFGRHAAKWDALRCLSNVLRLDAEEERDPGIVAERIEHPIFITGLPRSGTTLLHSLLAEDPAVRVPRCWQTLSPYPEGGLEAGRRSAERQLRLFQRLAPEMAALHPLSADDPQECTEITAQVFQSLRYEMSHRVPSYQTWLDRAGHLYAYRFHKRFLQHLQHQQGSGRWALKCPDHIHALDAIESVYPDCRIVFVHRDPLRVIASAAKLTEVVRRPFTRQVDRIEIGQQVLGRVVEGAQTMIDVSRTSGDKRVRHLHYTEFARDPVAAITELYAGVGMEMTPEARRRMSESLAAMPRTQNTHNLADFGLDAGELRDRFVAYMRHFKVRPESAVWKTAKTPPVPIAA